jgi:hypothetical protein
MALNPFNLLIPRQAYILCDFVSKFLFLRTFGANALSGPVPKEIGLLTDLRSLAIDMNNFSGSLPPEIGNCTRLVKMYIGSSGLSGEIPSSFANFVNLEEA